MNETPRPLVGGETTALELDLSGRQLGDYRLLRRLGRGAMAEVYLAEQGSLRRQVAFKALKRELAADETYVRRFHHEAQAAAALVQANIVQIYEVGCVDGLHYIAQEYVEGQNLAQFLSRNPAPDVKLAIAVMRQVAAALSKASERGIVHRDIKPENIMMSRTGEVKVADFGLARTESAADTVKLTQAGITMGTPLYMSPEQVEGRPVDSRSDIYSLGVTCYHVLAGQPPFRGDTALSVALQHVRTQPDRLELARPDLPPAISRIIHTMLAKDPKDRYQSPRDLLRDLRTVQVPGMDGDWGAAFDERDLAEVAALAGNRGESTQRLQSLMQTQSVVLGNRRWIGYTIAAVAGALILGAGAAWALRAPFLLDVPAGALSEDIPRYATAQLQFQYAETFPSEAAWKSVEKNFPNNKVLVSRSQQQLAKLYLQNDDLPKAMELFTKLADMPDVEVNGRAYGLAGQAIVDSLNKKPKESAEKLAELFKVAGGLDPDRMMRSLNDIQMVRLVAQIIRRNDAVKDKDAAAQWDNWLETHFTDESG